MTPNAVNRIAAFLVNAATSGSDRLTLRGLSRAARGSITVAESAAKAATAGPHRYPQQ